MHRLLRRQLRRYLGEAEVSPGLSGLFDAISSTYSQNDQDRELIERSLELSSDELTERNQGLEHQLVINRASQKDLEHTLSLLDATLDATEEGILVVDLDGSIVKYNAVYARIWGFPEQLLLASEKETMLDFVLEKIKKPELYVARVKELKVHPLKQSVDTYELCDGRVLESFTRPQMLQGECVGRVWSFRDITAKKAAAARLELASRMFEVSSQGIMITDADLQIVDINQSLSEMLLIDREQVVGLRLPDIQERDVFATFNQLFVSTLKAEGEWWGELKPSDGEKRSQLSG